MNSPTRIVEPEGTEVQGGNMAHKESTIQRSCVQWFRIQYPELSLLLFAVPNGGGRSKIEAAIMKGEGVVSGVADLLLLVPNVSYHGLCIEMKTESKTSKQSPNQKTWAAAVKDNGYEYRVARSLDEFRDIVNTYLFSTAHRRGDLLINEPSKSEELAAFLEQLDKKERNGTGRNKRRISQEKKDKQDSEVED